jgi:hypothetical protein
MKTCNITLRIIVFTKHNDSTNSFETNKYLRQTNWLHLNFPLGQCTINRILPPYYDYSVVLLFPLNLQCLIAMFKSFYQCSEVLDPSQPATPYVDIQ